MKKVLFFALCLFALSIFTFSASADTLELQDFTIYYVVDDYSAVIDSDFSVSLSLSDFSFPTIGIAPAYVGFVVKNHNNGDFYPFVLSADNVRTGSYVPISVSNLTFYFNGLTVGTTVDIYAYAFQAYPIEFDYAISGANSSAIQSVFISLIGNLTGSYDDRYQAGYDDGYDAGVSYGHGIGYFNGLETGKAIGYSDGYDAGVASLDDVTDAVFAIVDAPARFINNFLNFEFLGVNLAGLFFFLVTAAVVFFIMKKVKS